MFIYNDSEAKSCAPWIQTFHLGELKIYQQLPLLHLGISDYSPKPVTFLCELFAESIMLKTKF